jgi:hypothetical protein
VFDMCDSSGPGTLTFNVNIDIASVIFGPRPPGFPTTLGGTCKIPVTFRTSGISTPFKGSQTSEPGALGSFFFGLIAGYDVRMRVETAGTVGNSPKAHQDVHFQINIITFDKPGPTPTRALSWGSHLDVPEATGQVVVNGAAAVFAGPGRSTALATGRTGENRVEAQLVQGAGKPGTWRFDLPTASLVPGSLRVLAGDVALLSGESVVFRLSGRAGERVVFSFRTSN